MTTPLPARLSWAQYLIGCDGGRSLVRKAAGIDFPGSDPTTSNLIAEELGIHRSALGLHSFGRTEHQIVDGKIVYADKGPLGVMVTPSALRPRCAGQNHDFFD